MRNIILLAFLISLSFSLFSAIIEVSVDGTKPYTSIQMAINSSSENDIVRVWPGIYRENINFNHHNITLQSLYPITGDTLDIHNTKIIGNHRDSAIRAQEGVTVIIDGFTIMNNENDEDEYVDWVGGGIFILSSNVQIKNNIITKCTAGQGGGGICISDYLPEPSYVYLENNQIFNCKTYGAGGGLSISQNNSLYFSEYNRNSIYNNYASFAKDISISGAVEDIDIYLKIGSQQLNSVDQYFIANFYPYPPPIPDINVTVDILQGFLPSINHDLYVAPWGNDLNSGLNPNNPLKSIDYATKIIASDSTNQKTVHLAAGTYSRTQNQQKFPFSIKPDTKLIGAGMDETIFDDENHGKVLGGNVFEKDVEAGKFSLINCGNGQSGSSLGFRGNHVKIYDIKLSESKLNDASGICLGLSNYGFIKNIIVKNNSSSTSSMGMTVFNNKYTYIENVIIDSLKTTHTQGGGVGVSITNVENLVINNMSITNCQAFDPWVFQLANFIEDVPTELHDPILNNVLVANNHTTRGDWDLAKVIFVDNYNTIHANNWTIANNTNSNKVLGIGSDVILNNMILYNPEMPYEIEYGCELIPNINGSINNSLIMNGTDKIIFHNNQDLLNLNHILTGDPHFIGVFSDSLSRNMMDYYQLSSVSECINRGTADTTGLNIPKKDLSGKQRVWDGRIDMGCFEYGAPYVSNTDVPEVQFTGYNLKNYPNPITSAISSTIISFDYPEKSKYEPQIEIYNIKGQKIKTIKTGSSFYDLAVKANLSKENLSQIKSRNFSVIWDLTNDNNRKVASGVYLYRAVINGKVLQTKKMLLMK